MTFKPGDFVHHRGGGQPMLVLAAAPHGQLKVSYMAQADDRRVELWLGEAEVCPTSDDAVLWHLEQAKERAVTDQRFEAAARVREVIASIKKEQA